jgi:hypothetical protein
MLAPGGFVVLDDFTASDGWPPIYDGQPDELRIFYLTRPDLTAVEVPTGPTATAIPGVRR